jgi:polyhydroxyalkanoate synthase
MDLQPENSLIRWLSAQGFTVFVCSWVNPDKDKAGFGFDEYLEKGIYRAVEKVLEQTGSKTLNTVGYCIGGTLMGAALAHMAAKKDSASPPPPSSPPSTISRRPATCCCSPTSTG